jgi:hypothetical protein
VNKGGEAGLAKGGIVPWQADHRFRTVCAFGAIHGVNVRSVFSRQCSVPK